MQTLLHIPDISGFTEFVAETEIRHSAHIIKELLELIIESDELGLEVQELEGDAVFFARSGEMPDLSSLEEQVERTFVRFHSHLRRYDADRVCDCGACASASGLSLKFVTHVGDVEALEISNARKLIGESVVVVHRLLKNSVPLDEYHLVSEAGANALDRPRMDENGAEGDKANRDAASAEVRTGPERETLSRPSMADAAFEQGQDDYKSIGTVPYRYRSLSEATLICP